MTAKQFFKSTAFKCVVTLLCVLLISGIFLTVMNGLLAVSEEEKFNRQVGKLYPDSSQVTAELQEVEETKVGTSTVEKVWFIPEKNDYLVQIYGSGRDGKLTVWVIVETKDKNVSGVGTVLVYDKVASEYADKIPGWNSNISNFSKDYEEGIKYAYGTKGDDMYINTGASVSFATVCGCVNDAITFIQAYASGGSIGESPYEDFLYNELINQEETTVSFADGKVTYNIKTVAYGGVVNPFTIQIVVNSEKKIESFVIPEGGNGSTEGFENYMPDVQNILKDKDLSYFTGIYGEDMAYTALSSYDDTSVTAGATTMSVASRSTYVCMYAGAFATANYDNALLKGIEYTEILNMDNTSWTVGEDGKVTYNIKTVAYGGVVNPFTIQIVVNSEKKIESFVIPEGGNGSTYGFENSMPDVQNILKDKDLSYFTGIYGEDMSYTALSGYDDTSVTTGATTQSVASRSTYVCMYAGAFATANYDLALLTGGSTNE